MTDKLSDIKDRCLEMIKARTTNSDPIYTKFGSLYSTYDPAKATRVNLLEGALFGSSARALLCGQRCPPEDVVEYLNGVSGYCAALVPPVYGGHHSVAGVGPKNVPYRSSMQCAFNQSRNAAVPIYDSTASICDVADLMDGTVYHDDTIWGMRRVNAPEPGAALPYVKYKDGYVLTRWNEVTNEAFTPARREMFGGFSSKIFLYHRECPMFRGPTMQAIKNDMETQMGVRPSGHLTACIQARSAHYALCIHEVLRNLGGKNDMLYNFDGQIEGVWHSVQDYVAAATLVACSGVPMNVKCRARRMMGVSTFEWDAAIQAALSM